MANSIQSSIAKAREAQKKFEETKAKVEAAKKKAEDAIKRAKAIQQRLKEAQAIFKAPGGAKSGISAIIASQVGSIRGKLIAQIQNQVLTMLNKFANECPNAKELQKIIKIRNTLLKHLTGFEKRVTKYSSTATTLTSSVRAIQVAMKLITSIPTPTVVVPFGDYTGGIGMPVKTLTKFSDTLIKLDKRLTLILGEAEGITGVINTVSPVITNLKNRLTSIDLAIQQCSIDQPADLTEILTTTQPPENTGSEGVPNSNYLYKNYVLSIVEDPNSPKIAPRRYAIATNSSGLVLLRGDSSFSSDTQVLLDELKFRIDNQLP